MYDVGVWMMNIIIANGQRTIVVSWTRQKPVTGYILSLIPKVLHQTGWRLTIKHKFYSYEILWSISRWLSYSGGRDWKLKFHFKFIEVALYIVKNATQGSEMEDNMPFIYNTLFGDDSFHQQMSMKIWLFLSSYWSVENRSNCWYDWFMIQHMTISGFYKSILLIMRMLMERQNRDTSI